MSSNADTVPVFHTVSELRSWRSDQRKQGKTVGLVPTMGALHNGHLTLVSAAQQSCDTTVVSIFVNPAQFAPHEDLDQYPRTLPQDIQKIAETQANCVVFAPLVSEMYPNGITTDRSKQKGTFVEVLGLSEMLEGGSRPHFFRGVATVVSKLFHIVMPEMAFFGQKDVQQCCVIKNLVADLLFPIKLNIVPTVRDPVDGLALSSRNVYLTEEQRAKAPALYRGLCAAQKLYSQGITGREELIGAVAAEAAQENLDIEYICLSSPDTLEELDSVPSSGAILSSAWRMGKTRLIDNVLIGFEF
ncbi:pantoate-beta-alanine ligase [Coemansia erecta]|uniref:Pantoate--beta-alanine ligase n=1 Tax=Coemansia asiatica TaxID=1052880 RepID=A0A9W7XLX9_9FUNG|nr:pantoate-beta-alanine ligase [Coemansia asiatica]KAJ2857514.1 pantoate-beta-alanine ligase [Coemansia erecta]KAJ2888945.1 pantoate-beta-alanine ligase [Coemansia asiatica]